MGVVLVIVVNFGLEELIGLVGILNLFVGKEGDQAFLQSAEEAFDFAFCLRGRGD